MGILQEIISEISTNLAINIRKLDIGAENGVFSCVLLVLVNDVNVVNQLCKKIKKIKGVNQAVRIDQ
jgi:GTP pyrophosphokinase